MFGYLRPMQPEMKISEYQAYKAVYCGFCRALSRRGFLLRFSLSYDFTFYSLLALSLTRDFCGTERGFCPRHPFKKRLCVRQCDALDRAADLAILLLHAKLRDNLNDRDHFRPATRLLLCYLAPKKRRIAARYPQQAAAIERYLQEQWRCEAQNAGLDACCDPTGQLLADFFALLSPDLQQQYALQQLGSVLGRFIYLLDAADDLPADRKSGSFNPLNKLPGTDEQRRQEAEHSLNVCISAAQDCLLQLQCFHFCPILENILFLGLKNTLKAVLHTKTKKERRQVLYGGSV